MHTYTYIDRQTGKKGQYFLLFQNCRLREVEHLKDVRQVKNPCIGVNICKHRLTLPWETFVSVAKLSSHFYKIPLLHKFECEAQVSPLCIQQRNNFRWWNQTQCGSGFMCVWTHNDVFVLTCFCLFFFILFCFIMVVIIIIMTADSQLNFGQDTVQNSVFITCSFLKRVRALYFCPLASGGEEKKAFHSSFSAAPLVDRTNISQHN